MQLYVHGHMKLPLDIVIGTVPLRESLANLPAPQMQRHPPSAPQTDQLDAIDFDLRMFCLLTIWHCYCYAHTVGSLAQW